jgi:hypothetical protein
VSAGLPPPSPLALMPPACALTSTHIRPLQLSLDALGAKPGTDIAGKLLTLDDRSRQPGVLFVSPGRYTIGRSLTLGKPVVFAKGAVFVVPTGASIGRRCGRCRVLALAGAGRTQPAASCCLLANSCCGWRHLGD